MTSKIPPVKSKEVCLHSTVAWKYFQINFGPVMAECRSEVIEHVESCLTPSVGKMELLQPGRPPNKPKLCISAGS